jgi:hypothetical protein
MSAHKFRIGQSVNYRPAVGRNALGRYQVIRFLPPRKDGEPEYQIKHLNEGHERLLGKASCARHDAAHFGPRPERDSEAQRRHFGRDLVHFALGRQCALQVAAGKLPASCP